MSRREAAGFARRSAPSTDWHIVDRARDAGIGELDQAAQLRLEMR